jgi:hypothetical protein
MSNSVLFSSRKMPYLVTTSSCALMVLLSISTGVVSAQEHYVMSGEWLTSCESTAVARGCTLSSLRPFVYPTGIAIDSLNNVYVVDTWTKEIQKFTSDGKFITKWGNPGNEDGQFRTPTGIAIDSLNNVYVIDRSQANVQKFTSDGKFLTKWGTPGIEDGQFRTPTGIAIDSLNNVYVIDPWLANIQKFTSDGKFITKWGTRGTEDGQFANPTGIAVDPSSNVYVVDQYNNRIQKFTSDGEFITNWGTKCQTGGAVDIIVDWELYSCIQPLETEFFYPGGISVDKLSNVYVVDQYNNRIQKFTSDGDFITTVELPDYRSIVLSYSRLGHSYINVDDQGNKIFTTVLNDKILIFSKDCYDLGRRIC